MLSDDTSWAEMEKKIGEYHATGVDLVWVLDARSLTLRSYARGASSVDRHRTSFTSHHGIQTI